MRQFLVTKVLACSLAFFYGGSLAGEEIIFRTPSGDLSVLEIDSGRSFAEVMHQIKTEIDIDALYAADYSKDSSQASNEFLVDFMAVSHAETKHAASTKGGGRDYSASLQPHDKQQISYIVETLGNSSLVSIAKAKSSLERSGREVEHVHPLQFLNYVFSTEKLKAAVHNIRSRSWVWGKFFKGLRISLEEESNRQNLLPYLKDFCKCTGADLKKMYPLAEKKDWKQFVETLLSEIPRSGNSGRYDM